MEYINRKLATRMIFKHDLAKRVSRAAGEKCIFGLLNGEAIHARGGEFLYADHSYFRRGWDKKNFRLVRNGIHLTRVIPHKEDRLGIFGVRMRPWRKSGGRIVVFKPSPYIEGYYGITGIAERMAEELKQYTDREIFLKAGKEGMPQAIVDAWACVCPVSVAGVEAAVLGIPVFSTPMCPTWPISAGELKDIESPNLVERYEWANGLAWSSWHGDEIETIDYENYQRTP